MVKARATKSGNMLIADKSRGLFGFFSKDFLFLGWTTQEMWEKSKTWGNGRLRKKFEHDPFPYTRIVNGIEVHFYPQKNHPRHGVVKREYIDGDGDRHSISFHEAISLKGGNYFEPRTESDIRAGQRYWENLQASFIEAKESKKNVDTEKHVDAFGVDEDGYVVAYHYHCDRADCQCVGGWWTGSEEKVYETFSI